MEKESQENNLRVIHSLLLLSTHFPTFVHALRAELQSPESHQHTEQMKNGRSIKKKNLLSPTSLKKRRLSAMMMAGSEMRRR